MKSPHRVLADEPTNKVQIYSESSDEDYADVGIYEDDDDANDSRPMSIIDGTGVDQEDTKEM